MSRVYLLFTTLLISALNTSALTITQKPINFSPARIALTKQYMQTRYGLPPSLVIKPRMIVVHFTEFPTLEKSFSYFNKTVIAKDRGAVAKVSPLNVSAHFLIDRDGSVYQLMPTNWMARHVIGLDYIAIGIENVGGMPPLPALTKEQLSSNIALIKMLKRQYPEIKYLIGHYEYGIYRNSILWKERDPNYFTNKKDPGEKFMKSIRSRIKTLGFQPDTTLQQSRK